MQETVSEHVYTLLIGYRSGGTPGFPQNLRVRDWIAGCRRGSSACQRPSNLPALRVARRYSSVGFDRQQYYFYNRSEGKVFVARNSVFLEKEFLNREKSGQKVYLEEVQDETISEDSTSDANVAEQVDAPVA